MKVVMMRQKSLESSIEKSDQNSVDGMRQDVYSKGKELQIKTENTKIEIAEI